MEEKRKIDALTENLRSVIFGKDETIRLLLCAFFAGGHVLVEDSPGLGKTSLARALAGSIDGSFRRIQFTSDMLPQDIIGYSVFNPEKRVMEFRKGPLFANVVLADEINRTNPKTQAAFLEAMSEGSVTVDAVTHPLPDPFFVIATQNPFEFHGTFPLPESQLDRFTMKVSLGPPDRESEIRILQEKFREDPISSIRPVLTPEEVKGLRRIVTEVHVDRSIDEYIVEIVRATRRSPLIRLGASPRCAVGLKKTAAARALIEGRDFVTPDDVKSVARAVVAHRIFLKGDVSIPTGEDPRGKIVDEILDSTPSPL
ncbi:MAG: MoxR family ATPase [Deltaproteobacteria bacterium]|nr:MAG: MoxR family ATPase [Deltaproteobacteria bacterium]